MPISKTRRKIIQKFLKEQQLSDDSWKCCGIAFSTLSDIGRHVNQEHAAEIQKGEREELDRLEELSEKQDNIAKLKQRRGEKVRALCNHCYFFLRRIVLTRISLGHLRSNICSMQVRPRYIESNFILSIQLGRKSSAISVRSPTILQ